MVDARSCCRSLVLSFLVLPGAAPLAAPPPSSPVLQLQHAVTPGKIIEVAHDHLGHLGASHISHAFYRVSKLVVSAKHSRQREGIIQDMRLMDMFSAALERVSSAGVGHQHLVNLLLACGIMEWPPASLGERADCGLRALTRALNSRADGLADHELSSIMWALEGMEQLGAVVGPTDAPRVSARLNSLNLPFRVMQRFLPDVSLESSAEGVAWARDMIELGGGVALPESRLTAWQSNDPSLCFEYSGKRMEPLPFTPGVDRCRLILKEETGVEYDAVLLNLYPSGKCGMRYHSDPGVGEHWTEQTAVISAGGDARMFIMRESADHSRRHSFWVKPSDCVIMFGDCQDRFQHCIRVERDAEDAGPRMSMVFKQSLSQKGLKASS